MPINPTVDRVSKRAYTRSMLKKTQDLVQWLGALFIIAGHVLNSAAIDGWNILAFTVGTVFFMLWSISVANRPQQLVNTVAIVTCTAGLFRAFG